MKTDRVGNVTEIGGNAELNALRAQTETNGIDGVVWDGETVYIDVADGDGRARLEQLELSRMSAPVDRRRGEMRHIYGHFHPFGDSGQTGDMIAMLVGNEDTIQSFGLLTNRSESLHSLAHAQTGIHQQPRLLGCDKCCVAGTAAGENADFDHGSSLVSTIDKKDKLNYARVSDRLRCRSQ
jgi:hypothetical protein